MVGFGEFGMGTGGRTGGVGEIKTRRGGRVVIGKRYYLKYITGKLIFLCPARCKVAIVKALT